ncbi:MAG: hypothetical protein NTZ33_04620 [Bacteroidetes bacterium]|nr:hypothetical protein [Bacteroidota bacterium]
MAKIFTELKSNKSWLHGIPGDNSISGKKVMIEALDVNGNITLLINRSDKIVEELVNLINSKKKIAKMLLVTRPNKNPYKEDILILIRVGFLKGENNIDEFKFILEPKKIIVTTQTSKGVHLNPGPPFQAPSIKKDNNIGWYFFDDDKNSQPHEIIDCDYNFNDLNGQFMLISKNDISKRLNMNANPDLFVLVLPDKQRNKYVEYKFHQARIISYDEFNGTKTQIKIDCKIVDRYI